MCEKILWWFEKKQVRYCIGTIPYKYKKLFVSVRTHIRTYVFTLCSTKTSKKAFPTDHIIEKKVSANSQQLNRKTVSRTEK